MLQFDENFLVSLGLGSMPTEEKKAFLVYLYDELVLRVGAELSKDLSDEQLEAFEKSVEDGDRNVALGWLEQYCSNYQTVVQGEIDAMKSEIIASKDQLLE